MYNYYHFKNYLVFITYSVIYLILIFVSNYFIFTDSFYYSTLSNELPFKRIEEILEISKKTEFISYIIFPIILLLKWIIITAAIFIVVNLFSVEINFENILKIVILAEIVIIFAAFLKVAYFLIFPPNTMEDVQRYSNLGIAYFFDINKVSNFLIYPILQFNLFEVSYWLLLIFGVKYFGFIDFKKSLKIISLSYGVGLIIWCIFIIFLQLQFS